jgi:hypothetical protein
MSAAVVVLPMVWASIEAATCREAAKGPVSLAGESLRKGPHTLRLVQASAPPAEAVFQTVDEAARLRPSPQLAFYRKYTEAMLRRYVRLSMEGGRAPSLLGRELFRGKVSDYKVHSFDDVVIFVHDVEKCIAKLGTGQQYLLRKIAMQGYSQEETAAMIGANLRTIIRRYYDSLDRLTRIFLDQNMLAPQGNRINKLKEIPASLPYFSLVNRAEPSDLAQVVDNEGEKT